MATDARTEDEEKRSAAVDRPTGAVALADESPDELPALLAIAVGVAILAVAVVWPSIQNNTSLGDDTAAVAEVEMDDHSDDHEESAEEMDELDTGAFLDGLGALGIAGIGLSLDGSVVTATGEVPDEATRAQVIAYLEGQPGVTAVIDALTITQAEATGSGEAVVDAAQTKVVLTGVVPDQATHDAIYERAVSVYSEAQVDNQLEIDENRGTPTNIKVIGSLTDPVLHGQLVAAFSDIEGVEVDAAELVLEESNELESSLNSLEPIQFASGSAQIDAASNAILDQAADYLKANPDVAIQIGGHTDSIGDEGSNQSLSQARAEAVMAALTERGVTNSMETEGFGERRLKNDPDDTPEKRAENRRIEFRIIG